MKYDETLNIIEVESLVVEDYIKKMWKKYYWIWEFSCGGLFKEDMKDNDLWNIIEVEI